MRCESCTDVALRATLQVRRGWQAINRQQAGSAPHAQQPQPAQTAGQPGEAVPQPAMDEKARGETFGPQDEYFTLEAPNGWHSTTAGKGELFRFVPNDTDKAGVITVEEVSVRADFNVDGVADLICATADFLNNDTEPPAKWEHFKTKRGLDGASVFLQCHLDGKKMSSVEMFFAVKRNVVLGVQLRVPASDLERVDDLRECVNSLKVKKQEE